MKVVQRTCFILVAVLVAASCGTGSESARTPAGDGDRNVALADDDGRPFAGLSASFSDVAIDVNTDRVWLGGRQNSVGLVTGGLALHQEPKYGSLDPTFPRIRGTVRAVNYHAPSGEIAVAGNFYEIGDRGRMVARRKFALLDQNGLRDTSIDVSGSINTIVRIGTKIFLGGNSSRIVDLVSGLSSEGSIGLHRINSVTGRVEVQRPLQGIDRVDSITGMAPGRALPPNPALMAVVIEDPTLVKPYSLRIFDINSGALVKSVVEDQAYIEISSIEGGSAIVETQADADGPSIARLLDIEAKSFVTSHAPPNELVMATFGQDGRARVLSVEKVTGTRWLTDLDKRTFAVLKRTAMRSTNAFSFANFPGYRMVWMDEDSTLLSNGVMYEATTDGYVAVRANPNMFTVSGAVSLGARGLLVGGGFDTSVGRTLPPVVQLPETSSPSGVRGVDGNLVSSVSEMVTTTKGVVAFVNDNALVLIGSDTSAPPVRLASIVEDRGCRTRDVELAVAGDSLFVAGCWSLIEVNGVSTGKRVVEIDIAGGRPVFVQGFDVGDANPHAVAATSGYVFVSSKLPRLELMSFRRDTGDRLARREMESAPNDMVATTVNGEERVYLGGRFVAFPGAAEPGSLMSLSATEQNATTLDITYVADVGRRVETMAIDLAEASGGGPRHLYLGGIYLGPVDGRTSVTRIDLETGRLDTQFNLSLDVLVDRVAVHEGKVWVVGGFNSATATGRTYRVSGVVGYDAETHAPIVRSSTPVTTTNPPTSAPVVGPDSSDADDSSTGEPIGPTPPPDLPTSGDPAVGTYSIDSGNGVRSQVQVLADGSMNVLPGDGLVRNGIPFIERLVPGSRTVKVSWLSVPGRPTYKVTTGKGKSRRTCTTTKSSCTVKNLDPWKPHTFIVEAVKGKVRTASVRSPAIRPFVRAKKGSSSKVSSIAPQGAKGKARWTTTSPCVVKNAKLLVPKKTSRCTLTVSVGTSIRTVTVRIG